MPSRRFPNTGRGAEVNREKFSTIGHEGLVFWNPVEPEVLLDWLRDLPLNEDSRVLDVGCGRGEFLIRLVEHFGCAGVGVDPAPSSMDAARQEVSNRIPDADLQLYGEAFHAKDWAPGSFDLAVCIGSSHAMENYPTALDTLANQVRPGGLILIGEGYWQQDPHPDYLAFLGSKPEELLSHQGNQDLAEEKGLRVLKHHATSPAGWSAYEDTYAENLMTWVDNHPEDEDAPAFGEKISAWREAYLNWGKDTLGFGLYLLQTGDV